MTFKEVRACIGTLPELITAYHSNLDVLSRKKIRWRCAKGLSLDSILVSGAASQVNILTGGAVIVAAMAAAHVVNRLSGEGFRRKTCPRNDYLAVFVLKSGVCGLKTSHFSNGTACWVNQTANSSSLREPSARCRKVKYFSSGVETIFSPFRRRKPSEITKAVRLFPSIKAWFRASPNAYEAASRGRVASSVYTKTLRGLDRAESRRVSSRRPSEPPCSANCLE